MSELSDIEDLLRSFFESLFADRLPLDWGDNLQTQLDLDDDAWAALADQINAAPEFQSRSLSIAADDMRRARSIADVAVAMFAGGKGAALDRTFAGFKTLRPKITFDSVIVQRADVEKAAPAEAPPPETAKPDNAEVTIWYGTNRKPRDSKDGYTSQRDDRVHYGTCRVFVPASHKIGSTGSGFFKRLLTMTDDRLKLMSVDEMSMEKYWGALAAKLASVALDDRHAVVFLHGYRVTFEEAALRAAQLGVDLSVKGAMAFFSWPSKGTLTGYINDEATIEASEAAITEFLTDFARRSGAKAVHIIAHSMGNRGLLRAVQGMTAEAARQSGVRFDQIILAAPDIDVGLFGPLSKAYAEVAKRTTLYVSQKDLAVDLSHWLHGFNRVGFAPPVFVTQGIDTINVTGIDVSMLGHSYVAEARDVLQDMHDLIVHGSPPDKRFGLREAKDGLNKYWVIGQ